jgi:hypothetical protein
MNLPAAATRRCLIWWRRTVSDLAVGVVGLAGCVPVSQSVSGPVPPSTQRVSKIQVAPLLEGGSKVISASAMSAASWAAFDQRGWSESHSPLEPLYQIVLMDGETVQAVYWLGANSHPPRFPCYQFCSGWWLAGSTASGLVESSRYKGLPDSVYFFLLRDLQLP